MLGRRKYTRTPTLKEILLDPLVDGELQKAWSESNPHAPDVPWGGTGSLKQEQGGWVVWNKQSSELEVVRVRGGTRDNFGSIVGTRPADTLQQEVVAWFHTHPNTDREGYTADPSPADIGYQNSEAKVPGIIETHEGRKTIPYP